MQVIRIIVSPEAKATVEGEGFSGPSCLDKARSILQSLGRISEQTLKPDFYDEQQQTLTQEQ